MSLVLTLQRRLQTSLSSFERGGDLFKVIERMIAIYIMWGIAYGEDQPLVLSTNVYRETVFIFSSQ